MLLKLAKSKGTINYLLPTLAGLLFWMKELMNPTIYPYYRGESENLLFQAIDKFLHPYEKIQIIFALAVVITLAYLLQQINNHYNFIRHRSFFPALTFIIIISGFTGMHSLHPVYLASIFIGIAIYRLFDIYERPKPYSAAFDAWELPHFSILIHFCYSLHLFQVFKYYHMKNDGGNSSLYL